MDVSSIAPIVAWIASFTALNVIVKSLSGSLGHLTAFGQMQAMLRSPWLYVAGVLYVCCALLYFFLLGRLPLSVAGPVFMVLGIVITTAIGAFGFGEPIGLQKSLGMAVCLVGLGLIYGRV